MKKLILAFSACFAITVSFTQGGYLPNIGFEDWTSSTIYENPDNWSTSNYREHDNLVNATQSTDAQHLSASLLLQNVDLGTDTAFAYAFLGIIGESGPEGGVPYVANVDQLNGYYKGTIMANDTAMIMAIKFLTGNMVSIDVMPVVTSQTNWTPFTMSLTPGAQDSIFVGFISSNPFVYPSYAKPGTAVMFDNISLSHSTLGTGPALPNFSFETWSPVVVNDPDGWSTLNGIFASSGVTPVTQTSDANSGASAAEIETLQIGSDTIPGFLFYADFDVSSGQVIPVPYNASPTSLNVSFKYSPVGGDQGFVSVEFYNSGNIVGGNNMPFNSSGVYQSLTMPTNISSTPDSIALGFFAGNNPGSILIIDDVQFSGGDLSVNENAVDFSFETYPNPATENLTLFSNDLNGEFTVMITDMRGEVLLSQQLNAIRQHTIDVSELAMGMYHITILSGKRSITKSFSVVR